MVYSYRRAIWAALAALLAYMLLRPVLADTWYLLAFVVASQLLAYLIEKYQSGYFAEARRKITTSIVLSSILIVAIFAIVAILNASKWHFSIGRILVLVTIVFAMLTYLAVRVWGNDGRLQLQLDRDKRAQHFLALLETADRYTPPPEFYLFLRPFSSIGSLKVNNPDFRLAGVDFETLLSFSLETHEPAICVIGLSYPDAPELLGTGRIFVAEDRWQQKFKTLAEASRTIVIIPSYHEGTLYELEWIRSNELLDKTVFIMPPTDDSEGSLVQTEWEKTVTALNTKCLFLNDYDKRGQLFKIGDLGVVMQSSEIDLNSKDQLLRAIQALENII